MVRNYKAIGAERRHFASIVRVENSLDYERPPPLLADKLEVTPRHGRIEIVAHPREEVLESGIFPKDGRYIAKLVRPAQNANIPGPARPGHCLHEAPCSAGQAWRARESRSVVTIARSRYRHIDCKDQRAAL